MKSFIRLFEILVIVFSLFIVETRAQPSNAPIPSDDEIRKILAERIHELSADESGVGIVVGVIGPKGRRIISYGHPGHANAQPPDGNTVFEIGSVTKAFTGILLAEMVRKQELSFQDPVSKYLAEDAKIPTRKGRAITLLDLATHTSSLPFMPEQSGKDSSEFSGTDIYQFLSSYELTRDIGTEWDYSNLGYWLLSEALISHGNKNFEKLLNERVIVPLNLRNTAFELSPEMKTHLAIGHDAALQPSQAMSSMHLYALMPAAGGLYSTVNDLLTLLSVAMEYDPSPLRAALQLSFSTRRPTQKPEEEQALGWSVIGKGNNQLIFRDGGTMGYASCIAWDPQERIGVIALSNQVASVSDIARHLLRRDFPLEHPTSTKHTEISLDPTALDNYIGQYEAPGEGIFSIIREGDALLFMAPDEWGLPKLRIRPESTTNFFASELPLKVIFQMENDGRIKGILVYPPRGQKAVPAQKVNNH